MILGGNPYIYTSTCPRIIFENDDLMRILITGGAGYIGYSVVKQLFEDVGKIHSITI